MSKIGKLAVLLAVLGIVAIGIILFGARLGLWEPLTGFRLYRSYLNPLSYTVAGFGLAALIIHLRLRERTSAIVAGLAMLIGLGFLVPTALAAVNKPQRAAPIHDITTDTQNPPQFEALDDTRQGGSNSLVYEGAELAQAQAVAYPGIAPLITELSPKPAFTRALQVATDMGWTLVDSDPARGRFEATARTPVFHFADDIVVAVRQEGNGSRVDMRSVSRVGRSDQGVNAARIEAFQENFSN